MSHLIDSIHDQCVHRFNPLIANGVAVAQMESALQYIDNAFKLTAQSFPPELKYLGFRLATVQEEVAYLTHKRTQQHAVELAPSDVYMVNYIFSWNGEELPPKPLFVPFLSTAGRMNIRGKKFTILPVLADETISVSKEEIYIPFLAAKVTFKRDQHMFKIDNQPHLEYLVYSTIHNHKPEKQPRRNLRADTSVKAHHTMPHYLFCKFGLKETFRRFYDTRIEVYDGSPSRSQYPENEYAFVTTAGVKPRSLRTKQYTPTNVTVVIPRNKLSTGTLGLLSGFFYVLDHYVERFSAEMLDGTEDELRLWRVVLGHAIFRNNDGDGKHYININEHIASLDQYLDDMTRENLASSGYAASDFWELISLLIHDFTTILMNTNVASMYGKSLIVNRYILSDIIKSMSILRYKLTSSRNRVFTAHDVNKYFNKYLKPEIFFNGLKDHNEVQSIQCAGDNIMFNYTSRLILQENATGKKKRKAPTSFKDPSKLVHTSIAVAGSILALPKAEPTGKVVLNPCLPMDRSFMIKCPQHFKAALDEVQKAITPV